MLKVRFTERKPIQLLHTKANILKFNNSHQNQMIMPNPSVFQNNLKHNKNMEIRLAK